MAQELRDAVALDLVVLDDEQTLAARARIALDARKRLLEALGGGGLLHERECAAREPVVPVLVERDDLHGNVPGRRILLELAQHRPAEHVRQEDVERDRGRMVRARERERLRAARRDQHLESLVLGGAHHQAREVRIVLDDEHHAVAGRDCASIVGDLLRRPVRRAGHEPRDRRGFAAHRRPPAADGSTHCPGR